MAKRLSVVMPCFEEHDTLPQTLGALEAALDGAGIPFEAILVDDGSKDATWATIRELAERAHVRGVRLSKNFGKEAAILAGVDRSRGDCVVVMDADGQHPAATVVEMYEIWRRGEALVVEAVKARRGEESVVYGACSRAFYGVLRRLSGIDLRNASDFRLLDRKVVDAFSRCPERSVFFRALTTWLGYPRATVTFEVSPRLAGRSKWSTWGLVKLALTGVTSFSNGPLHIVTLMGLLFFAFSFLVGGRAILVKLRGDPVDGITILILLNLITGSLVMFSLGMIGEYLGRIYQEVKGRPRYLVDGEIDGPAEEAGDSSW